MQLRTLGALALVLTFAVATPAAAQKPLPRKRPPAQTAPAQPAAQNAPPTPSGPVSVATASPEPGQARVQIALLLDTSNSMDGLIGQAKTELWRIVNEIAAYERGGNAPFVEVALYEYGKQSLPVTTGYVRQIVALTTDLDSISEALFALQTNGGDEFCGLAIERAGKELAWSRNPDDYKAIFIAGNEPFDQGRTPWREAVLGAKKAGIVVNTIHCGNAREGIATHWQAGAALGLGSFMAIDQEAAQVHIATPYDAEIAALGEKLNDTYVGYGRSGKGAAMKARQAKQDSNSKDAGGSASVERASAKGKAMYNNEEWDLVDAQKKKKVAVEKLTVDELPAEMKALPPAERQAYVDKKAKEREVIQAKIGELDRKRRVFLEAERKKSAVQDKDTFDAAMRRSLKVQMSQKKFMPKP